MRLSSILKSRSQNRKSQMISLQNPQIPIKPNRKCPLLIPPSFPPKHTTLGGFKPFQKYKSLKSFPKDLRKKMLNTTWKLTQKKNINKKTPSTDPPFSTPRGRSLAEGQELSLRIQIFQHQGATEAEPRGGRQRSRGDLSS